MNVVYKGFDIRVVREMSMGAGMHLYFTVIRKSDGYIVEDAFTEGSDTVREYIGYMKERVDGFLADPSEDVLQRKGEDDDAYAKRIFEHKLENERTIAGKIRG